MPGSPRVDFYILDAAAPDSRLAFACRLTEKVYGLGNKVYAHVTDAREAEQLDKLLWTFRQGSFVPHEQLSEDNARSPVSIGTPARHETAGEVLINLTDSTPEFAANFSRVAEIIDGSESSRQAGRQRFRQYKDMGLQPETHNIK